MCELSEYTTSQQQCSRKKRITHLVHLISFIFLVNYFLSSTPNSNPQILMVEFSAYLLCHSM